MSRRSSSDSDLDEDRTQMSSILKEPDPLSSEDQQTIYSISACNPNLFCEFVSHPNFPRIFFTFLHQHLHGSSTELNEDNETSAQIPIDARREDPASLQIILSGIQFQSISFNTNAQNYITTLLTQPFNEILLDIRALMALSLISIDLIAGQFLTIFSQLNDYILTHFGTSNEHVRSLIEHLERFTTAPPCVPSVP